MLEASRGRSRSSKTKSRLDKIFYNLAKAKGLLGAT